MNKMRKLVALATLTAMIGTSAGSLDAQEYYSDCGGCGYEDSWCCPSLTPYIALGTVAVIAIVAIAVRHHHGGGAHGHSTSTSH